jgi:hypothetical protein
MPAPVNRFDDELRDLVAPVALTFSRQGQPDDCDATKVLHKL